MEIDAEKLEQPVLALLHLNSFKEGDGKRAWKSLPWEIMDSLHQKGYISDPAKKNKSVWLTETGAKVSEELFEKLSLPSSGTSAMTRSVIAGTSTNFSGKWTSQDLEGSEV